MVYPLLTIFCPITNLTITKFESGCNLSLVINCTTAVNCCIRLSFIAVANCAVLERFRTNPLGKEDVFIEVPFGAYCVTTAFIVLLMVGVLAAAV